MKHHSLLLAILLAAVVCGCTTAQALPKKSSLPEFTVIGKDCYMVPFAGAGSSAGTGKSGYYVTIILDGYPRETRVAGSSYAQDACGEPEFVTITGAARYPNSTDGKCYLEAKVGEVLRSECR